jgi:ABC-type transporter Mla MlaB component
MLQEKNGALYIVGRLDQQNTLELIQQLVTIAVERSLTIDLSRIEHPNSIVIALLVYLKRKIQDNGHTLTIINWPNSLLSLIELYSLNQFFNITPAR